MASACSQRSATATRCWRSWCRHQREGYREAPAPLEQLSNAPRPRASEDRVEQPPADDPEFVRLYRLLRAWWTDRVGEEVPLASETLGADGVPAYSLFSDRTMRELAARRPTTPDAFAGVWGLGLRCIDRFGSDLLVLIEV